MTGPAGRAPRPVPAIEVGGSHVTAAFVDLASGKVGSRVRRDLEPDADAETLLHTIAAAATTLGCAAEAVWSAAVPGPFDYATGVAHYRDVGKFESLTGVHVGMELMTRIKPHPSCVRFIGDAMAFTLGEYHFGSAHGHSRVVGITLGTGVGTGFVADGHLVTDGPDVPEQGRADPLLIGGKPWKTPFPPGLSAPRTHPAPVAASPRSPRSCDTPDPETQPPRKYSTLLLGRWALHWRRTWLASPQRP